MCHMMGMIPASCARLCVQSIADAIVIIQCHLMASVTHHRPVAGSLQGLREMLIKAPSRPV
jgi:hypothetical protein